MSDQVKITIEQIRDSFEPGKIIFCNKDIEIIQAEKHPLGYCMFLRNTMLYCYAG